MRYPKWALEAAKTDAVVKYLIENDLAVSRVNYVGLNWCGEYDASKPLPGELEADIPGSLQIPKYKEMSMSRPAPKAKLYCPKCAKPYVNLASHSKHVRMCRLVTGVSVD